MGRTVVQIRRYWIGKTRKVLVEGTKQRKKDWLVQFKHLAKDFAHHAEALKRIGMADGNDDGLIDARELLIWAWVTLKSMPFSNGQNYVQLREDKDDEAGIPALVKKARRANFVFSGLHEALELQLQWCAALVRAVDEDLSGISSWPEDPASWRPEDWQPTGYDCYVVPVHRDYRLQDGKSRERRAARHHAIVPVALGELAIELHLHPGSVGSPGDSPERMSYGAALFDGMTIDLERIGDDEFLIGDAPTPNWREQLDQHFDDGLAAEVDVLAWPELTMPDERLAHLKERLEKELFADGHRIHVLAAGSWHVAKAPGHVNRMEVLDRRGVRLLTLDKRVKYTFGGLIEAITPGDKVPLLVTRNRLIGFAICRDFCEDCDNNVFREISADLIVLPSMGTAETVEAHLRHAKSVQSIQGSVVFAVQQIPVITGDAPAETSPLGYSFAHPLSQEDILAGADTPVEQLVPFRSLQARI